MSPDIPARSNRLIHEKSPYLQQHAHNPVDWYPWGEEAFGEAQAEHKPILLSIGYSTCHWCHVMAHESFEDPEIAAMMNRWFVNIKVDREEHPDVDRIYMGAVVAMTGQGGWPLTVFLTPDRKPFFGTTYVPPERRWHIRGMKELLPVLAEKWAHERQELVASADRLTSALQVQLAPPVEPESLTPSVLDAAFHQAIGAFDPPAGGFGSAPKFPRSHGLSFLLRYWLRTGDGQALEMVTVTLSRLARGGIRDHLGGGFHRYATDGRWLIPHFEKMLYDQALLARTYLEAFQVTHDAAYAEVAREIFTYVLRDLTDPSGGFYAAEDADSEGHEGTFYVWEPRELIEALGEAEGRLLAQFYGVRDGGNFENGRTVLNVEQPTEEFAKLKGVPPDELARRLREGRRTLLAARDRRPRPHRDEKILSSWNGLMIASLAYGGSTLGEPRYVDAARRAADFLLKTLRRNGALLRRYRDGEARFEGTLEDYAFLSYGLLELYEAGFAPQHLAEALTLAREMIRRFWDEQGGGFLFQSREEAPLIARAKDADDGAMPSGNSMAALVMVRLGALTGNREFEEYGRRTLEALAGIVARAPFGSAQMLMAWDVWLGPTTEVVVSGDPDDPITKRMLRAVQTRFLPRTVRVLRPAGTAARAIGELAPWLANLEPRDGKPSAYVCEQHACRLPVTNPEELERLLDRAGRPEMRRTRGATS